ncbi:MAG: hypothetical protein ABIR14_01030, partial [Candidatus Paceibacterota bacterium]
MKARIYKKIKKVRGFSTLEVMFALVILVSAITVALMLLFGGQNFSLSTDLNHQGVYLAQKTLEEARSKAQDDFGAFNPDIPAVVTYNDIYTNTLTTYTVLDADGNVDPYSKRIESVTSWLEGTKPQSVTFSTIVT